MATLNRKEKLFDDFHGAATHSLRILESQFGVTGLCDQIFGSLLDTELSKARLRASDAWLTLSALYDYAVDGVQLNIHAEDIVLGGSEVLSLVSNETARPSKEWSHILSMADGRFALDAGEDVMIEKVALLANVDIRTVRNAVSAGDLLADKVGTVTHIENPSARAWLLTRKGFRPTVLADNSGQCLESVVTPAQFGAFLIDQRERIGGINEDRKLTVFHRSVSAKDISQLEAGIFSMPLDAVFPIADFYQVGRREMLECVMRVFFRDELEMLMDRNAKIGAIK